MFINSKFILGVLMFCGGAQASTYNASFTRRSPNELMSRRFGPSSIDSAPNARSHESRTDKNRGMQPRPVTLHGITYAMPYGAMIGIVNP
jgi:hypothetical protein